MSIGEDFRLDIWLVLVVVIALIVGLAACESDPTALPTRTVASTPAPPTVAPTAISTPAPTPVPSTPTPTATRILATAAPTTLAATPMPKPTTPLSKTMTPTATASPTIAVTPTTPQATSMPSPEPTSTPSPEPTETLEPEGPVLPATVMDVHGNEIVVEDISRIVVMNGDVTEVVFALGLGANVVAVDTSATYPPEVTQLPQIGYQRRLSAEGVLSMEPTVVIGNENAGPPEVIEQIRAAGVPVVVLESVTTVDGASQKIRGVAKALGVPDKGETIVAELEAKIGEVMALAAKAEEHPTAVFLYMRGLDTLFLIGRQHLSHELFEASGAISGGAAAGVDAPFVPLTAEALTAVNPDCIVVLTAGLMSVGGREGLLQLPGVGVTKAADEGCILDFDDQYFGGGGPRMGNVLMDLLRIFHPDLAPAQ